MSTPISEPLPGLEPDPTPYPEPPADEQVHLAAKDEPGGEAPGDGTAADVDSQP